jgi:Cu/Ag efflux protein CusF
MVLSRSACIGLGLLVLTGCAAYTPPPLTTEHPAHSEAAAAPEPPRSRTLAYTPADIPTLQPASFMAQRGTPPDMAPGMQHDGPGMQQKRPQGMTQGMPGAQPSALENGHTVVGEGTVVAVVPASEQIVVDHGAITGFMDAMTMGYTVNPPSLLAGLQAGDRIRFTIDPQTKAIVKVEKLHE